MSLGAGPSDLGLLPGGPPGGPVRARRKRRLSWRAAIVATVSTIVVFGLLVMLITGAPGWADVQASFLNPTYFWGSLPAVVAHFWVNVQLFVIAEVLILVLGLVLAVLRSLPGPVFFPVRLLATIYVDLFRALPGVLVIYVLGFGIPGLGIVGIPVDPFLWAVVALTLIYSAYVSEVYRAGIDSIHPSQDAAA
ncbi:MAG: ABC transporter permease subunit, partial [Chloroflexota bacterium]